MVEAVGDGVSEFAVGDAVCGWTERRASHAEFVAVPTDWLIAKPSELSWEVAGSLFVASMALRLRRRGLAAGGRGRRRLRRGRWVGSIAVQLAVRSGATVIGLASERNHEWLRSRGVVAVTYGEGQAERIRAAASPGSIDAFIDTFGGGYVDLAVELGVPAERINTIADFAAIARLGVKGVGTHSDRHGGRCSPRSRAASPTAASRYRSHGRSRSSRCARHTRELAARHTHGKIALLP